MASYGNYCVEEAFLYVRLPSPSACSTRSVESWLFAILLSSRMLWVGPSAVLVNAAFCFKLDADLASGEIAFVLLDTAGKFEFALTWREAGR